MLALGKLEKSCMITDYGLTGMDDGHAIADAETCWLTIDKLEDLHRCKLTERQQFLTHS
jgi:hypothetical protein